MLASFQYASNSGSVFSDTLSNDIILRGWKSNQRLVFGFGSNVDSTMQLSYSNLTVPKSIVYASNVSINTYTPSSTYQLYVNGSARIEGDIMVNGTTTTLNTDVKVTEQFSVSNNGTGPALIVTQYGAQPIARFVDDNTTVMTIADGGFVCVGSNTNPATKLDVEGNTTIRGNINTSNLSGSNINLTASLTSCNIVTSNLIINNQVIIASNGVITNSNFLPPMNTSNIVSGQFTSNFILNDNITSSKLASNLYFKGVSTFSSNVGISNGDLTIKGSNNWVSTGDQARLYLGSNDYFLGASKDVGIFIQAPGTTYPFLLEQNSGFLGLGTMDPQENLHVAGNTKVEGSSYVLQQLSVGTSNPSATLHIVGDILATSNVKGSVGTLGPTFRLIPESAYADIAISNALILDQTLEAGNPGSATLRPLFYGNSFLYQDASGEGMQWNSARLLFRGCPLTPNASVSTFIIQDYVQSRTPQYSNISSYFNLSNAGSSNGYVTYSTPWFSSMSSNARHIEMALLSNTLNVPFRVGQVLIQFRT